MIGAFIQLNEHTRQAQSRPVGYVICENGCWEWIGARAPNGYGRFRHTAAHRVTYEMHRGPIPEGLTLDHLCRNKGCVNPDHLEAVVLRENIVRGTSPAAARAKQTHCKHGHPLSGDNVQRQRKTGRRCGICRRAYQKARYAAGYRQQRKPS